MDVFWLTVFLVCIGPSISLSPSEMCRLKVVSCSSVLTAAKRAGNQIQCSSSVKKDFMSCVNQTMSTCDASLTLSDIIGPVKDYFDYMCLTSDKPCLAADNCQFLMTPPSQSTETPSTIEPQHMLVQNCSMAEGVMRCMDAALTTCNLTFPTPYNFTHLTGVYGAVCQSINQLTCPQMNSCMGKVKRPTDPKGRYDPQHLCSSLKSMMACANSVDKCTADRSSYKATIGRVNQVCSDAPMLVNVSNSNDGPPMLVNVSNSNDGPPMLVNVSNSNDGPPMLVNVSRNDGPNDHGSVHRVGILTVSFGVFMVLLFGKL